jgi:gliding motility-associated-like protein
MNKFTFTFFAAFLLMANFAMAQCPTSDCTNGPMPGNAPGDGCIICDLSELNGYSGTSAGFNGTTAPDIFCGSIENSQFFPFIAPQANVSFVIDAFNCSNFPADGGLQAEVYENTNCGTTWTSFSNCNLGGTPGSFTINATGMTPGGIYYLMIDGFAGDDCDFTIDVTNPMGGGAAPPLPAPDPITPDDKVCFPENGSNTVTYTVPEVDGALSYEWTIIGSAFGTQDFDNPNMFDVTFDTNGSVEICVEATNACSNSPQTCVTIQVEGVVNPPIDEIEICPGEDVVCGGQLISSPPPGFQEVVLQSYLGCDSVIGCNVNFIFINPTDLPNTTACAPFSIDVCGQEFTETDFITVTCTSYQGCDSIIFLDLAVLNPMASINPPDEIGCSGGTGMVTLDGSNSNSGPSDGTTSYEWSGPSFCGPTDEITACVDMAGQYCLTLTHERDDVECTDMVCVDVTENIQTPEAPTITAPPGPVCEGDIVTYTVNNFSGPAPTGYTISIPNDASINMIDDNTFEVDWTGSLGGDICATPESDCGAGPQVCITVDISAGPIDPTFTGELLPCANQNYAYSISNADPDATYTWTAPGAVINGSGSAIDIDFSSAGMVEICVTCTNTCGDSNPFCETVTVVGVPATPTLASGNQNVCGSANEEYCVNADADAIDYTWTTPIGDFNNAAACQMIDWASSNGGQICVTANNDCGSSQPLCFNVTIDPAPTATLSGMGAVCANSMDEVDLTVNFTGTGPWTFVYNDGTMDVTVMSNDAVFTLTVNTAGNYTPVSVSDQTVCAGTVSGSATVTENPQPTAVLSGNASICQGSGNAADLTITLTGTAPWTVNYTVNSTPAAPLTGLMSNTETLSIPEAQAGNIEITSVTDGNGCTNTGDGTVITVEVNDAPIVSNIMTPCNAANDAFTVTFEITGGDPASYTVNGSNMGISAGPPYIFTSNEITSGMGYDFTVDDANNCNPASVSQASVICACDTEVGTMDQMVMNICGDGPVTAVYDNTNEASDGNDILVYYLHEGSGVSIVDEVMTNPTEPTFSFMAGMTYGTTYYISAVNGNDNGMGGVDLGDGCTAVAQGTPVVFLELPTATLGAGVSICTGETANLQVTFTGTGPWNLEYDAGNGIETVNGINANPFDLGIMAMMNTTVTLTGVASVYPAITCDGMASGMADITVNTAVEVINVDETCNANGTAFTVTFEITGGDAGSYTVDGATTGISAGPPYIFTSNEIPTGMGYSFVVDDVNNCSPATVSAPTVICDCNTEVGVMNTDTLTVCGDGPVTAIYDMTNQNFDGDDVLNFVLHTGSSTTLGMVLQTNTTDATFSFGGGTNYGTVYYISAIVGNDDGAGNVDDTDPCLDVAAGTPVVFFELPTGDLTADASICNGDAATLSVALSGDAPWTVTIDDDMGGSTDYMDINTNPFTVMVSPTATTVYTLAAVSDDSGCPGMATGSATITVNDAPTLTVPTFTFNATNTGYTVSFEITGGDPATYAVMPANGTISAGPPYIFTSNEIACGDGFNFSVDDANGCGPVVATQASVTCSCDTQAGMMMPTTDPLMTCGDGPIDGVYDGGETLDANDVVSYVLLDGAMTLNTNTTPSFSFNQNNMTYGQIYQICAVAGDDNGSGIASANDPCYSIGTVCVDILFFETPTAELSVDGSICTGDSLEVNVVFTGTAPFDLVYQNNNTMEQFTETGIMSNSFDFFISPTVSTVYNLVSATDANGCEATLLGASNVMVNNAPTVGSVTATCNLTNTEFIVSFPILGGDDASYVVMPAGSGMIDAMGIFTSNPLPTGSNYSFFIDDANGCGPFEVSGAFACDCETEVGTIVETELNLCEGDQATITHENFMLDPDDILQYIIHDGSAAPFGDIVATSATPTFDFDPATMTFGTTYFIAAIIGNDDGTGNVDEDEPCFGIVQIPVTWGQTPTLTLSDDESYCLNAFGNAMVNIGFTITPAGSTFDIVYTDGTDEFTWDNVQNGGSENPLLEETVTYTIVSITDLATGCSATSTESITLTLNEGLDAGQNASIAFCEGTNETVDLASLVDTNADLGGTFADPAGNTIADGMVNIAGLTMGTYDYTYTVAGGAPCPEDVATLTIEITPPPTADAGVDQTLTCADESVELGGANTTAGATYMWDGPVDNPTAALTTTGVPGTYTLTVTTPDGCTGTDVVVVDLEASIPTFVPTFSGADCFGDSNGFITVDSIINGTPPYQISFNDEPFGSNTTFTNLSAGMYSIVVQDANGCEAELDVTIQQPDELNVVITGTIDEEEDDDDITINLGDELVLTANVGFSFDQLDSVLWTPPLAVGCDTCETNTVSPASQQTYSVYVEQDGCSDTDQITVFVGKDLEVYVPNVFSPNGDGANDFLTVFGDEKVILSISNFTVFNRWGEEIYSVVDLAPNDVSSGWDGTQRNRPLDSQVFVWFAEVVFVDGTTKLFQGDVTLIK